MNRTTKVSPYPSLVKERQTLFQVDIVNYEEKKKTGGIRAQSGRAPNCLRTETKIYDYYFISFLSFF